MSALCPVHGTDWCWHERKKAEPPKLRGEICPEHEQNYGLCPRRCIVPLAPFGEGMGELRGRSGGVSWLTG